MKLNMKLPKLPKPSKSWLIGAVAIALAGSFLYTGTYRLDANHGAYLERIPGMGDAVDVTASSPLDFNFPWPLGKTHVIPFQVEEEDLKASDGHAVVTFDITYDVLDSQREAYVEKYGPMVQHKSIQERMIEAYHTVDKDGFQARDILSFPRLVVSNSEDNLDYATSAAIEELLLPAARQHIMGRSIAELEQLLKDPDYVAVLKNDIQKTSPMVTITELNIKDVDPAYGWITAETKEGFHIDLLVRNLGTKVVGNNAYSMAFGSTQPLPNKEVNRIIEGVVAEHYLVEFASTTLPKELQKEFLDALNSEVTDTTRVYSEIKFDLSMARAQFHRTYFHADLLNFYSLVANEYMNSGDTERAVRIYEGLIDYTMAFPLNERLRPGMIETYYSLALLYDPNDQVLNPADWTGTDIPTAVDYYLKFYSYTAGVPEYKEGRKAVGAYLMTNYADYFNITEWEKRAPPVDPPEETETPLIEETAPITETVNTQ